MKLIFNTENPRWATRARQALANMADRVEPNGWPESPKKRARRELLRHKLLTFERPDQT